MSVVVATTVAFEPNLINPKTLDVLVTTTLSPPPASGAFVETLPAATVTVPVGRNGLIEPLGMAMEPSIVVSQCVRQ
jgi:hypothetical protein